LTKNICSSSYFWGIRWDNMWLPLEKRFG